MKTATKTKPLALPRPGEDAATDGAVLVQLAAMQKLSEEHRTVVTLHDIQGLPHDEIAKILECNPGTVRSRLFYARQQLQAWLADFLR